MRETDLQYAELVWNPLTGCSKVSEGCKVCFAEIVANRMKKRNVYMYRNGFELTFHEEEIRKVYNLVRSRVILVNTTSDTFHEDAPIDKVQLIFRAMNDNYRHTFQVLTKRAEIMLRYNKEKKITLTDNIWLGVSVENNDTKYRIDLLRQTSAKTKFVAFEPLLEDITDLDLTGIDWVIVGGEKGLVARDMEEEWVRKIRDLCIEKGIPFFFKQWNGSKVRKKTNRLLDGREWNEIPAVKTLGIYRKGKEKGKELNTKEKQNGE